jgi:serine/threonine protein kinase
LAETESPQLIERAGSKYVVIKENRNRSLSDVDMSAFLQEISIMWLLRESRYICQIVGFTQNPNRIIMQYYEYGPLDRLIHSSHTISQFGLFTLILEIAKGMEDIHRYSIAHLDMKPANILLYMRDGELHPVITDFGISAIISEEILLVKHFKAIVVVGQTRLYCAPEMLKRDQTTPVLLSADLYSYAVILLAMLNRKMPWSELK